LKAKAVTLKTTDCKTTANPLVVLFKMLANALLEDKYGINTTAYNSLLILAATIDKNMANDIKKKAAESRNRYRYD
jgi:hypothetical protein